jgi:hypothetical protein
VLTTAANPSAGGTVTPTSGGSYNQGLSVPITATANPGYTFLSWSSSSGAVASPTSASTTITMNAAESVTAQFSANLVVNEIGDDAGTASNCSVQPTPGTTTNSDTCSLRDALLEAAALGAANISFDSTQFATAQTITLGGGGTLQIPNNTAITGPTSGSGPTLTNLVTVSGASTYTVFSVGAGLSAAINNLIVTNGYSASVGGGISSYGVLTLSGMTISNNSASSGGGIFSTYNPGHPVSLTVTNCNISGNSATNNGGGIDAGSPFLVGETTVTNSTISGNSAYEGGGIEDESGTMTIAGSSITGNGAVAGGGGIGNGGTLTVSNSTFTGDYTTGTRSRGGGIFNGDTLTVTASTISANSVGGLVPLGGGGISNEGTLNLANSIVAGNMGSFGFPDIRNDVTYNDNGGNVANTSSSSTVVVTGLAPLGNYGGPTQTMLPLPGSAAICAGLQTNVPNGVTTDQRGFGFLSTYCPSGSVDSGAVQTNYALGFTTSPSATQYTDVALMPATAVALTESGVAATLASGTVTLTDTTTTLAGHTAIALSGGSASFPNIGVTATASSDTLTATLPLNPAVTLPLNPAVPVSVTGTSSSFAVDAQTAATWSGPASGSSLPGPTATFSWTGGVGIQYYELLVGTNGVASTNIYYSGLTASTSLPVTIPTTQPTLYVRFRQLVGGSWQSTDFTYNEPATATLTAPLQGTTLAGSTANFAWSGGVGVVYYELLVGTNGQGSANVYNSGLISPATQSETVTLPANEPMLYASFRQLSGGVWQPYQYSTYNEPAIATLTAPLQGTTLTGTTANFSWSGGVGVVYYELLVGTNGQGSANVYNSGLISPGTQSETVTLPANEPMLYASFRQFSGGAWQPYQYSTYNEPTAATLTAPTQGGPPLSGSTAFTWSGGVGVVYYELLVGTTGVGSSNVYYSGLLTAGTQSENVNIPSNGATLNVRLRQFLSGAWQSTDYTFAEQ